MTYAADVGEEWSGSVRLGLSTIRFDETDPAFLTRRKDRTRSAVLTRSHRGLSWKGYQSVSTLDWSETDSTVPQYDQKLAALRVGLRRLFFEIARDEHCRRGGGILGRGSRSAAGLGVSALRPGLPGGMA